MNSTIKKTKLSEWTNRIRSQVESGLSVRDLCAVNQITKDQSIAGSKSVEILLSNLMSPILFLYHCPLPKHLRHVRQPIRQRRILLKKAHLTQHKFGKKQT